MKHSKPKADANTPKWFQQAATITMKREVEDAIVSLYIAKDLDPEAGRQKGIAFGDLLPYMAQLHRRWTGIKPSMIDLRHHSCMKALYSHFIHIRQQPKKLVPLIEIRR